MFAAERVEEHAHPVGVDITRWTRIPRRTRVLSIGGTAIGRDWKQGCCAALEWVVLAGLSGRVTFLP